MPITLLEAINQALDMALENDENVVVFGEDAGYKGGVFKSLPVFKRNMVKNVFLIPQLLKMPSLAVQLEWRLMD